MLIKKEGAPILISSLHGFYKCIGPGSGSGFLPFCDPGLPILCLWTSLRMRGWAASYLSFLPVIPYVSNSVKRMFHGPGLLVTLYKAQFKNCDPQRGDGSFVDIRDSLLHIQTTWTFWSEKHNKQKWDFNLWIWRELASQHAGTCARRLKNHFQKNRLFWMHIFLYNKYELKMDGPRVRLLASPCLLLIISEIVPFRFALCLHTVSRVQGTSSSSGSADDTCYVLNTVLWGMTGLLTIFMISSSWRILLKTCWYDVCERDVYGIYL